MRLTVCLILWLTALVIVGEAYYRIESPFLQGALTGVAFCIVAEATRFRDRGRYIRRDELAQPCH